MLAGQNDSRARLREDRGRRSPQGCSCHVGAATHVMLERKPCAEEPHSRPIEVSRSPTSDLTQTGMGPYRHLEDSAGAATSVATINQSIGARPNEAPPRPTWR